MAVVEGGWMWMDAWRRVGGCGEGWLWWRVAVVEGGWLWWKGDCGGGRVAVVEGGDCGGGWMVVVEGGWLW